MVRVERAGVRAAGDRLEHRGLHFEEPVVVLQDLADGLDDLRAVVEGLADVLVDDQVHIALTVTEIHILQAAPLVREDLDRLGQEDHGFGVHRDLLGAGLEDRTPQADDITDVVGLEELVLLRADVVSLDVALDPALLVLQIEERRFAHDAFAHHAAGEGDFHAFHRVKVVLDIFAVRCHIEGLLNKRIPAHRSQLCQFVTADLPLFIDVFLRHDSFLRRSLVLVTHAGSFLSLKLR